MDIEQRHLNMQTGGGILQTLQVCVNLIGLQIRMVEENTKKKQHRYTAD